MRHSRIFFVLVASVAVGVGAAHKLRAEVDRDLYSRLDLLGDALAILQNHYVRELDPQELIYGAIEGMISKLDAHSSFLPPRAFQEMQVETQGEFGGIGIEITLRDDWLTIVAPIEGTPAARAGLEPADRIIAIEGQSTQGKSLQDAVDKLRGKVGTKVTITVVRPSNPNTTDTSTIEWSEPFDVELVRDKIRVRSVRSELKDDGRILYVRLSQFQARSSQELAEALRSWKHDQPLGIILDLRNDPGGLLDQAIEVADLFLREGKIVYTDGRDPSMHKEWYAKDDGNEPQVPLVVLINGGTASASEIVAGALQDHKAATIIGTRSFGKGSVQTILRLRDGSGIRVTTALYYTPSGRSIQAEGIVPDIVVQPNPEVEAFIQREEDLERHFEVNENGESVIRASGSATTQSASWLEERHKKGRELAEKIAKMRAEGIDPVLDYALQYLRGEVHQAAATAVTQPSEPAPGPR